MAKRMDIGSPGYPYVELNLWRNKLREQGAFATKAGAIRQAKEDAERTHAMNERFNTPAEERSELFIVVDSRTGEVIGGRMILDSDRSEHPRVDREKLGKAISDIEDTEGIHAWYDLVNAVYGTSAGECATEFEWDLHDNSPAAEERLREIKQRVEFFFPAYI